MKIVTSFLRLTCEIAFVTSFLSLTCEIVFVVDGITIGSLPPPSWNSSFVVGRCQGIRLARCLNYILLIIAEMPIYELTGNHTLSLSPLCL